jgi:LPS-assembly protein
VIAAALLWAHLALAQAPPYATELATAAGDRVDLTADRLEYDEQTKEIVVRGHALLRTDRAAVRADEIRYRQVEQRAQARGHVLLTLGLMAAVADEIDLDLGSLEATLQGGVVMQKADVAPEALRAAETVEALRKLGRTTLILQGRRIQKLGPNHYAVDGISFTPCDCKVEEPSWRIQADQADLEVGERVILSWPVFYVYGWPVLKVPWAYLPLGDRRTGFLFPRADSTYLTGTTLRQPLFVTLGESADLTLTPGWFLGGNSQPFGVRGPQLLTELRYAPAEGTAGRVLLGALYDLRPRRDPLNPATTLGERNGLRFEGTAQHAQDLGGGMDLRAELSAVSDGYYVRDLTADVLLRESQYLRSTAVLARRGEDQYADLSVTLRQDTRYGYSLFDPSQGPATLQRLPALRYALLDRPLWGPLRFSFGAEYARDAPLLGDTGDEGTDGVYDPLARAPDADGSQGDRRFQPGEREARDRVDLRPRVSAPFRLGDVARISPYAAWREDLYLGEASGQFAQRGYPMAGVAVDTELSRAFAGGSLRHTIAPSVELRSVPVVLGAPLGSYDELDGAVPQEGLLQVVAELDQRLLARVQGQVVELLRLDLAQGYDLLERRAGDSSARAALHLGWLAGDATARYSVPEQRLTQLAAALALDDGHGHRAYARYERLMIDGSDRQRLLADALVGPPSTIAVPDPSPRDDRAELLTAGGAYRFSFGLTIGYDAIIQPNQLPGARPLDPLTWQALTASYSPSCECWRLDLSATLTHRTTDDPTQDRWLPGWGVHFTLGRLGAAGL